MYNLKASSELREKMNPAAALEYLHQLFETVPDVGSNYNADEKKRALDEAKESLGLFKDHDNLLTVNTVKLLKEVSLKNPGIFAKLPIHVAKGIIKIHAIGPNLSLQRILNAVDICIATTLDRPYENLNEFINELQNLRVDLITDKNLDILIDHYPWGRIRAAKIYIYEQDPSPLSYFFTPPSRIKITETLVEPSRFSGLYKRTLKDIKIIFPKLETVVSKIDSNTNQLQYFLKNYPAESIWRFFIDADRKKINPKIFDESEPGYIISCMLAFFNLLSDLETIVTPDFVKQIHKDATKEVLTIPSNGKFRSSTPTDFGFNVIASSSGLIELKNMQEELNYTLEKDDMVGDRFYRVSCRKTDESLISRKVEIITKAYEDRLRELPAEIFPENPKEALQLNFYLRLENIVLTIQKLERLHPFLDGNCRTFCMLLLNRELLRNGLPPCLLTNPNYFDGLSQDEMINEILAGQNRYLELCNGAKSLRYGGTKRCKSFELACELDFKLYKESLLLALEAANRSNNSIVKNELLEKINNDLSPSVGNLGISSI